MHSNDNGQTVLETALIELDGINANLVALKSLGMTREATGAENAWLDAAIRVALTPAMTRDAADFKIRLLAGNVYGWAVQAGKANGLSGAVSLILGALAAEADQWGAEMPKDLDACGVGQQVRGWAADPDPGVLAAYRENAKPRWFRKAIRRYEALLAEIDAMLARREESHVVAGALYRSRDALIDVMAASTRDVAELERKQRAFLAYRELPNPGSWLFAFAMSVAFKVDFQQLRLPAAEIRRIQAMFPNTWTSNTRPTDEEWARRRGRTN